MATDLKRLKPKVLVAGHICADLIPHVSRALEIVPGGIVPVGAHDNPRRGVASATPASTLLS